MPKLVIHFDRKQAGALHCDACQHDLPEPVEFTPALIGFPCPQCGANMLTKEDYDKTDRLFRTLDWINKWFGPIFGSEPTPELLANAPRIGVKIHGDEVTIRRER